MLGWRLISERELALQQQLHEQKIASLTSELSAAKEYIRKCEDLIDHERTRIDSERERADRIADSLFQSNGLPPTSATVLQEQKTQQADAMEKQKDYMAQLNEIYGDSMDELLDDGAEALPAELAEAVGN
jgi:hypothetical protein